MVYRSLAEVQYKNAKYKEACENYYNSSVNTIKDHLKKAYSFLRTEVKREADLGDACPKSV